MESGGVSERVTFRQLLATRSFVIPYVAETQSILGDQLARFALSVLVYDRTNSAAAAAITYALTFLPAILGGFALGGLADRYEHGTVMIAADLARAALFVGMAIPHLPIWALIVLLSVAVFIGPAYSAAEVGFLSIALERDAFRLSVGVRSASGQLTQVLGFAVGGVIVVSIEPRGALLLNAASFATSALIVSLGLPESARLRRRARASGADSVGPGVEPQAKFAGLWRTARTRPLMVLTLLMGLFVLPEALVVPFGRHLGASTTQIGFLIASIPLGSAVGALIMNRLPRRVRSRVANWSAALCGIPLVVSVFGLGWPEVSVCWFASGVLAAYFVEVIAKLVESIPEAVRSAQMGIVGAWLLGAQGSAFALGGLLTRGLGIQASIAVPTGVGIGVAVFLLVLNGFGAGPEER